MPVPEFLQSWIFQSLQPLGYLDSHRVYYESVRALDLFPFLNPRTDYLPGSQQVVVLVLHGLSPANHQLIISVPLRYPEEPPIVSIDGIRQKIDAGSSIEDAILIDARKQITVPPVPPVPAGPTGPTGPAGPPVPPKKPDIPLKAPPKPAPPNSTFTAPPLPPKPLSRETTATPINNYAIYAEPSGAYPPPYGNFSPQFSGPQTAAPPSQNITPQNTAPQNTAPQNIAPQNTAPQKKKAPQSSPKVVSPPVDLMNMTTLASNESPERKAAVQAVTKALSACEPAVDTTLISTNALQLRELEQNLERQRNILLSQKTRHESNIALLKSATDSANSMIAKTESQLLPSSAEDFIKVSDSAIDEAKAADKAISDLLQLLPKALDSGALELHVYLRLIRQYAREQFGHRYLLNLPPPKPPKH